MKIRSWALSVSHPHSPTSVKPSRENPTVLPHVLTSRSELLVEEAQLGFFSLQY